MMHLNYIIRKKEDKKRATRCSYFFIAVYISTFDMNILFPYMHRIDLRSMIDLVLMMSDVTID